MKNFLYILMLGIFALAGCSGSNKSDEEKALTNNTEAEVIIRLGLNKQTTPSGRILGTYQDIVSITLSWTNTTDTADTGSTELEQVDGIWTGSIGGSITVGETYTFTAEAFNATPDLLFSGSTTQTVVSGDNNLNIVMVPEDDGTGSSIPVITNLAVPAGFLPGETLQIDFTIKGDSADSLSLGVYGFRGSTNSQDSQFETQEIDLSSLIPTMDGAYNIYSDNVSISIPAELSEDVISFIFQVRTGDGRSSDLNFTVQRGAIGQEKFLNFLPVPTYFNLNQGTDGNYNAYLELDGYDTSSGLTWSAEIQDSVSTNLMGASVSSNSGYLNINFTPTSDYTDVFLVITVQDPMDPSVTANYTYNIPQLTTKSVIETIGTLENNNYLTHNGTKKYLSENPIISGTVSTTLTMRVIDPHYDFEFHNSGSNSIDVSIPSESISFNLQPDESQSRSLSIASYQVDVTAGGSFQLEVSERGIPMITFPTTGETVRLSEEFKQLGGTMPNTCYERYPLTMPEWGWSIDLVNNSNQSLNANFYDEYNVHIAGGGNVDYGLNFNQNHSQKIYLEINGPCNSEYTFLIRLRSDNDPGHGSRLENSTWSSKSTIYVAGRTGFPIADGEVQYWEFSTGMGGNDRIDMFGWDYTNETSDGFTFDLYAHTIGANSDGMLPAEAYSSQDGLMTIATKYRYGAFTLRVANNSGQDGAWLIREASNVYDPIIKSEDDFEYFNTYFISEENSGFPPFIPDLEVTFAPGDELTGHSNIICQENSCYLDYRNSEGGVVFTIGYDYDNITLDTTGIYDLTRFETNVLIPLTYQAPAEGAYPLEIYRATQCQFYNNCP